MSGNSCNGNYARGTQSKGHSMKAKDELARLKRDLATLYKATSKEKAVNTGRPKKAAFYDGAMSATAWLIEKYKIEVKNNENHKNS